MDGINYDGTKDGQRERKDKGDLLLKASVFDVGAGKWKHFIKLLNKFCIFSLFLFGSKRDENGEWRRLHNEELHSLYRSPNVVMVIKSRSLRWANHVGRMKKGRSAFKILKGKPTGKRSLGRPRRR